MIKSNIAVKLFLSLLLIVPLIGSAGQVKAEDDITGHPMEEQIRALISQDIMKGYDDGSFGAYNKISRVQFASLISRSLNLEPDTTQNFSDMPSDEETINRIQGAAGAGIITGYQDGTFRPYQQISREHMAVMLKRALDYLQIDAERATLRFADNDLINKDYLEHVSVNVYYKIINGKTINNQQYFAPKEASTRGQAAKVIYELLNTIKAETEPVPDEEDPEVPGTPEEPEEPEEPAKPEARYGIGSFTSAGELFVEREYATYNEALSAYKGSSGKYLTFGETVIKMNTGIALTVPSPTSSLTNVYNESMTSAWTYVVNDTELRYLDADKDKVKVQVGNKIGYVKHSNVKLIPFSVLEDRSSYSVNASGELVHRIYMNSRESSASYVVGPAPDRLEQGRTYYSWDGATFFDANGRQVAEGYQYFQHLPARSATNYTAEEIDQYIIDELKRLEERNPNSTVYKDAYKRSKLVGLGEHLKKVEKEDGVNALMILALAQHESAYGMSERAQTYNNLFGLRVYDDNPANDHFETVQDNVDELLNEFWNKNYIPPTGPHANGAAFGHKGYGFNVKYASDPYWGAKAAGHMYRIDKALGGKDLKNAVQIGITTTEGLNIRTAPELTDSTKLFTYPKTDMPVIIKGEVSGASDIPWIKITSDVGINKEAYVSGHYVKVLPIVK
ncbi:S-layer homology domain-containing protein [Jeotgalibacillus terrae]|uniref:S-layer homology domain-containing protein n=1 Tax=Jeotgalibacillus terrae TaxID=587735 RepID=A0ABW5ZDR6_9BACL|nr:S-layer homology domain-containing protein [Jeotgalibacillus terrae]MBM7577793.1 beta-N-acetylglucosaminidase [Jeotgalibacillus terrae]